MYTHHERVNDEVIVLEGIESRGGVNSIFVAFSELESCHHHCQPPKHQEVKHLHFRTERENGDFLERERERNTGGRWIWGFLSSAHTLRFYKNGMDTAIYTGFRPEKKIQSILFFLFENTV